MSQNLIPTDVALGLVVPVPLDTESVDAASLIQFAQPIINAIAHNGNQIAAANASIAAALASFAPLSHSMFAVFVAAGVAAAAGIPISGPTFNVGPYTVVGADVLFPANGHYKISAQLELFASAGTPSPTVTMNFNASPYAECITPAGIASSTTIYTIITSVVVSAFATDKIRFIPTWGGGIGTMTPQPLGSSITIQRLS